jgi:hypothetical protein
MRRLLFFRLSLFLLAVSSFAQVNSARMLSGVNAQTGSSYTFVAADSTRITTFANGSSVAVTLPSGGTANFGAGAVFSAKNIGAGTVTITCSSCTINSTGTASSTLTLATGQNADLYSDGTNYIAFVPPVVSSSTPTIGDCLLFSTNGSGLFDPSACPPHFIQVVADPISTLSVVGSQQAAQSIGNSTTVIAGTATETGAVTLTSAASGSLNDVVDVDQGFGAAQGNTFNTYGSMRHYAVRLRLNNTANVRYWWGLANLAPQFGTAAYSTNTPNTTYCMFRYSAGTDTTIKAACGTSSAAQTIADTTVAVDTTASHLYEITNVGGATTSFNFLIDGTVRATISTTLPTAATNYGMLAVGDNQNTATAIGFTFFNSTIVLK